MVMLQILKSVDFAKTQKSRYLKKPFLPDNCRTYMNDNPKNNILRLENIRQKRLLSTLIKTSIVVVNNGRNKHKCNFYYVAMVMMMSQILKSVDFAEKTKI